MNQHELYMRRCIELANLSNGLNRPNPEVGSLIVYNDNIIGEGWHQKYGEAHAEVNAIASVKDKTILAESTIYVTLEPCFHFGKTPPCVDLILKYKIPRVVIGCTDPYHEVAGKSIQKLREAGVEVIVGVLENEVEQLNRRFFTNVRKNRPFIVLKYAVSADGFMGRDGENVSISGSFSQRKVHKMRSEEAAILVGTNTALIDNPQLNNRLYFGPQPLRLVLDKDMKLPMELNLFDGSLKTIVFTEKDRSSDRNNVEFVKIPFEGELLLVSMLEYLQKIRISSILVEGGKELLNSFIDIGLWDEAFVINSKSRYLDNGIKAPLIDQKYFKDAEMLENDLWNHYINQ
jgi:diaminohydroxyphosphoribosylaminopyrimidine deaminase / 5-amino-6-(5-phosphoribosylamino)uracil reductase